MSISKYGVAYDLTKSPYTLTEGSIVYYFSSVNHKEKFSELLETNRNAVNASLSNRFGMNLDVSRIADLALYAKVETRGYCIKPLMMGEFITCKTNIKLSGLLTIQKQYPMPLDNSTPNEQG